MEQEGNKERKRWQRKGIDHISRRSTPGPDHSKIEELWVINRHSVYGMDLVQGPSSKSERAAPLPYFSHFNR